MRYSISSKNQKVLAWDKSAFQVSGEISTLKNWENLRFYLAVARTGRTLDEMKAYVADRREMRSPTYPVPHFDGVVGRAANFVLHVGELMDEETAAMSMGASA